MRTVKVAQVCLGVLVGVSMLVPDSYAFFGKRKDSEPTRPRSTVEKKAPVESVSAIPAAADPELPATAPAEEAPAPAPVKPKVARSAAAKTGQSSGDAEKDRSRQNLDKTRWQIELYPMDGQGENLMDALIFENNQVRSETLTGEGYPSSNFSLSLREDQGPIWETMQNVDGGTTVFWRGEFDEDMKEMRGVMSRQMEDGTTKDFTFISRARSAVE